MLRLTLMLTMPCSSFLVALPVRYPLRLSLGHDPRLPTVAQAQYDAEQLITQREAVSGQISEALIKRAGEFDIEIDDVAITQLTFAREFNQAVELKQVAQQEAERARYLVEQAEFEKTASIIRTEGDGEAAELVSSALEKHGQGFIELKKINAARDIAQTMARSRNVTYLPGGGGSGGGGTPVLMNLQM